MKIEKDSSQAYLLRLWPVRCQERTLWRASLENVTSGERHGFADLETLLGYLFRQLDLLDADLDDPVSRRCK